jgi:AsmA-like C-terminal region
LARFAGVPMTIDADLPFHAAGKPVPAFKIGMTLDREALGRLGIDVDPERMSGSLALTANLGGSAGKGDEATVVLVLRDAALTVAEAGWRKPAGQPGTVKLMVELSGDRLARLRAIDVVAPGLDGRLSAQFSGDHERLDRVDLQHLVIGDNDIAGSVVRSPEGGWRADIHAARIDARPLFKEAAKSSASTSSSPPLTIDARIDRLLLGRQHALQQVSAELARTNGVWRTGRILGLFANGHKLSLRVGDGDEHRLALRSDDLGATLKLLGIADNVVGGQVTVDGQLSDVSGQRTLKAHIEGSDYNLTRASILARMLALPSLTGLASTLSGSGLWFGTLRGDITYTGDRVEIERLLASGEALGITASGWYDTDRDAIDLHGTVAPAYLINSIVGGLPVVGPLLGGGSQGLIAANYSASGPAADPQLVVNPLSALTPGILREIFAPLVGVPK